MSESSCYDSCINEVFYYLLYFHVCICDTKILLTIFLLLLSLFQQGGEVVQETITSNIHDDIIMLEFQRTDGTLITQLIDFRSVSKTLKQKCEFIFFLMLHNRPFFWGPSNVIERPFLCFCCTFIFFFTFAKLQIRLTGRQTQI